MPVPPSPAPSPAPPPAGWRLSAQAWWALLGLAVTVLLLVEFGPVLLRAFWIVFGGLLLGLSIRPLAEALAARRVPRGLTVAAVYLVILGLLATVAVLVVPAVESGVVQLFANLPEMLRTAADRLARIPGLGDQLPTLDDLAQQAATAASAAALTLAGVVRVLGELAIEVLVAFVLGYFVATAPVGSATAFLPWLPAVLQPRARDLATRLTVALPHAVRAQLGVAVFFGTGIGIGYAIVGVPYAWTIALVAGVVEIIPFVGSATALVLGVLSALTLGGWPAFWTLVAHQIVTHTEAEIVAPTLMGRAVSLHPGVILVGVILSVWMFGIVGGFFAVPMLVVVRTLLVVWHEHPSAETVAQPAPPPVAAP